MHDFCTYFDIHYLPRGLALYESLERHCASFRLWILCMDAESQCVLSRMSLPHARLISLEELEHADAGLQEAKATRSRIEYYFTCTPALTLYILEHQPDVARVTYVDADLFWFNDPSAVFEEMGEASILVVEHRFPASRSLAAACGTFNVGLLSFRRDPQGLACLRWWRERCIEWCYDRTEECRFADQKYLDQWPTLFTGVVAAQHKGVGSAPWNLATYPIRRDGSTVRIGGDRLILYHFHGFKRVGRWAYQTGLGIYGARFDPVTRRCIYRPYLQAVRRAEQLSARYRADAPAAAAGVLSRTAPRSAWSALKSYGLRMRSSPAQALDRFRQLLQGGFLITWGERVW